MTALGVIAGVLLLGLTPAYLLQTLRSHARPDPVSWGIWATLGTLGALSNADAGGGAAVIVLTVTAGTQVLIFLVALRGGRLATGAAALWPLALAAIGAVVWLTSGSPLAAATGVVLADACGLWPTIVKTWREPFTEPPLLWAGGAVAFGLGCLSVPTAEPATLLYPVYLMLGNLATAAVAGGRRFRATPALPTSDALTQGRIVHPIDCPSS
jgi:hypothetical protein